jgi:hypothetical protein
MADNGRVIVGCTHGEEDSDRGHRVHRGVLNVLVDDAVLARRRVDLHPRIVLRNSVGRKRLFERPICTKLRPTQSN